MAFVDSVTIHARAGNGGNGVVRWRRTKETARGGPAGGDGGRGGDVYLEGVRDIAALAHYRYEKKFNAEDGEAGRGDLEQGAEGASLVLKVPVGTLARIPEIGRSYEILEEGKQVLILRGGSAGKGNARFKSATHQNPFEQTNGKPGEEGTIAFELKLIADVGLVGLPNAGKSSLLTALTRATPKVGDYPFTTLEPNLGVFFGSVLADVPGIIAGASGGKGLGIRFLKHVERTGFIVHLVSAEQDNPVDAYDEVRTELKAFNDALSKKPEMVVLSKTDLVSPEVCAAHKKALEAHLGGIPIQLVSVLDDQVLKSFSDSLAARLAART